MHFSYWNRYLVELCIEPFHAVWVPILNIILYLHVDVNISTKISISIAYSKPETKQTRKHLLLPKYWVSLCIDSIWNVVRFPLVLQINDIPPKNREHDAATVGEFSQNPTNWLDIRLKQISYFTENTRCWMWCGNWISSQQAIYIMFYYILIWCGLKSVIRMKIGNWIPSILKMSIKYGRKNK